MPDKKVSLTGSKRRMSLLTNEEMLQLKIEPGSIDQKAVETILGLNDSTKFELTLIDEYTFNIF